MILAIKASNENKKLEKVPKKYVDVWRAHKYAYSLKLTLDRYQTKIDE